MTAITEKLSDLLAHHARVERELSQAPEVVAIVHNTRMTIGQILNQLDPSASVPTQKTCECRGCQLWRETVAAFRATSRKEEMTEIVTRAVEREKGK